MKECPEVATWIYFKCKEAIPRCGLTIPHGQRTLAGSGWGSLYVGGPRIFLHVGSPMRRLGLASRSCGKTSGAKQGETLRGPSREDPTRT